MATAGASASAILAHFYPGTSIGRRSGSVQVSVLDSPGPVVVAFPGGGQIVDAASGAQSPGFPVTVTPGGSVQLSFTGGAYRAKPLSGASMAKIAVAPTTAAPSTAARPATSPAPATTQTTSLLGPLLNALSPSTTPPAAAPSVARPGVTPPVTVAPPPTEAVSARSLSALPKGDSVVSLPGQDRRYRGTVQATAGGGGLQLTNTIDVEQYLRGMGEVPASWPAAALQAQAIAARTVAMAAVASGRPLCDTDQCQVYVGAGNEDPATSAAAAATRGKVLLFGGALAEAVYSASAGGLSATAEEGFGPGSPNPPYLQPASYSAPDPQAWAVTVPLSQMGGRFGYRGELTGVRVSRTGPSGRALELTLDGASGPMAVDGHRFFDVLGLRSTLYTVRVQSAEEAAGGEPADALLPGLASVRAGGPGRVLVAAGMPSLGRAPWVGLAVLLLAGWGVAASRARTSGGGPGRAGRGEAGPAAGEPADATSGRPT
jgi:SpoIID/LytB domain protein